MAHQYIPGTNSFGAIDNADNILKSESPFVSLSIDLNRLSFKTEYSAISAPFKNVQDEELNLIKSLMKWPETMFTALESLLCSQKSFACSNKKSIFFDWAVCSSIFWFEHFQEEKICRLMESQ